MVPRPLLAFGALCALVLHTVCAEYPREQELLVGSSGTVMDVSDDNMCRFGDYHNTTERCEYVKADPDCAGETFDFLATYACADTSQQRGALLFLYCLTLLLLFYLLGTTADQYFCPQIEELSDRIGLTPRVAGVTLLSLGNGAPDVFSGIAAVRSNQMGLVLGQLTGGGMFVTCVVAGGVIHVAQGIRTRFPLLRDIMMYSLGLGALAMMTAYNALTRWAAAMLLSFYLLFVALAFYSDHRLLKRVEATAYHSFKDVPLQERSATQAELLNKEYRLSRLAHARLGSLLDHFSSANGENNKSLLAFASARFRSTLAWIEAPFTAARDLTVVDCVAETWSADKHSRLRATVAVWLCPAFISYWREVHTTSVGSLPLWGVLLLVGTVPALTFLWTCPTDNPPSFSIPMLLLGFVCAAAWVDLFASPLVDLLTALGHILSLSEITMGATVLAWGNCVGDLTADVFLARNKREGMAITACYAGPMFNLLIVVGFGLLLHDEDDGPLTSATLSTRMKIAFGFLGGALLTTLLCAFALGKLSRHAGNRLPRQFSFVLWTFYAGFFVAMIVCEFL